MAELSSLKKVISNWGNTDSTLFEYTKEEELQERIRLIAETIIHHYLGVSRDYIYSKS